MLKLADFDGLKYTFDRIENGKHLVVVADSYGKSAEILIEDGAILKTTLSFADLQKATREIRNFRMEFLDYIKECIT